MSDDKAIVLPRPLTFPEFEREVEREFEALRTFNEQIRREIAEVQDEQAKPEA